MTPRERGGGEGHGFEPGSCYPSPLPSSSPLVAGLRGASAVGAAHTLSGRPHGDPFPLPRLRSESRPGGAVPPGVWRRANFAIDALNALDAPRLRCGNSLQF